MVTSEPGAVHSSVPRVAVIGCGHWGQNLVRNFHSLGSLGAIHDRDPATAARMSQQFGVPLLELNEVLDKTDIAAVAIAAPAAQHFLLTREVLAAGKDVFVEKPLALEVADAEELCKLAEESERILMVGHLLQYHPAFLELQALVHAGALGRVEYLYSNRLNLGRFRREESILWSFAPHDISMILSIVGSEPDEVLAVGATYLHKTIADVTTTHLSFPGGERAHIHVSWLHPVKEQKLVVVGDRAMVVFDDSRPWEEKVLLYRHRIDWRRGVPEPVKAEAERVVVEPNEPLKVECDHFLQCVVSRSTPRTDGHEAVRVLRVLQAADTSMGRGAGVRVASPSPAQPGRFDEVTIHESAYVDDPCEIGRGTTIWHYSHVLPGSRIGRGCTIGQNVMVGPDVTIGDHCKIQNNVSIYKGVTLEQRVFCGPSCVFTNVSNPRAEIDRKNDFKATLVQCGATIGANATIVCGNTIGAYSMIAAGAVVTHDVPPHALMAGIPARRIGWVSHAGERLGDDLVCPATARRYRVRDGGLEESV